MGGVTSWPMSVPVVAGPGCELIADGILREPVSAVSSLAFVVAGAVIVVGARRGPAGQGALRGTPGGRSPSLVGYGVLVAGIGLGSVAQHGPNPWWADLGHDLPLLATLAFITADAVADLIGRPRAWWSWALPSAALVPLLHAAPRAGDVSMDVAAAITVAISLARARVRPRLRRPIVWTVVLLAVGGVTSLVSDAGPLCVPGSPWQGHAVWHVLTSVALVDLAAALGTQGAAPEHVDAPSEDERG